MNSKRLVFLVIAITVSSAGFPRTAHGQRSGVEVWAATCGNCHVAQPADRYTAKDWDAIGTHMVITARLTDAQADALMDFLKNNARREQGDANDSDTPAAPPSPGVEQPAGTVLTPEQSAAVAKYLRQLATAQLKPRR